MDFSRRYPQVREILLERINPRRVILPMKMHYGVPCLPTVEVGSRVKAGQCVGMPAPHTFASPVHTGISGTVTAIETIKLPNGIETPAVFIENDMKRAVLESIVPRKTMNLTSHDAVGIIRAAGICGMGGEGIPTAAKISRARNYAVDDLLVNCLQSEPFATSDLMIVNEHSGYVVYGAAAVARACGAKNIKILISHRRKSELKMLEGSVERAARDFPDLNIEIKLFRDRFPQGYYRLVGKALYSVDMGPNDTLEGKCKAVMFNCATMYSCWAALADNMPLMERVVTVCAGADTHNVLAPIGTPVGELIATSTAPTTDKIIWGNCFTGIAIDNPEDTPIIKMTSAVTVVPKTEVPRTPCIHCGLCSETCPMSLSPNIVYEMLVQGLTQKAAEEGGRDCIACGTCSYICPAGIDLANKIALFASAGRVIEENSLLHNTKFDTGKFDIGEVSLLEEYPDEVKPDEKIPKDGLILPFKEGKPV